MNKEEQITWDNCLAVWKYIKDNSESLIEKNGLDIQGCKYDAIHKLELYPGMLHHCPMCEVFKYYQGYGTCELCPISIDAHGAKYACIHYTPYSELDNDEPDSEGFEARINDFYEYLADLAKRRGYYDDPNTA